MSWVKQLWKIAARPLKREDEEKLLNKEDEDEVASIQSSTEENRYSSPEKKKGEPVIVLASDGIAAEWNGKLLGQYSLSGEHNNSPYYVQTNTLSDSRPFYLYRADNNQWYVSSVLGKGAGRLKNPSSSATVPETGWKVSDGEGWLDDPQLTARCGPLTE